MIKHIVFFIGLFLLTTVSDVFSNDFSFVGSLGGGVEIPVVSWPPMSQNNSPIRYGYTCVGKIFVSKNNKLTKKTEKGVVGKIDASIYRSQIDSFDLLSRLDYQMIDVGLGVFYGAQSWGVIDAGVQFGTYWGEKTIIRDTTFYTVQDTQYGNGDLENIDSTLVEYHSGQKIDFPSEMLIGVFIDYSKPIMFDHFGIAPTIGVQGNLPLNMCGKNNYHDLIMIQVQLEVWIRK